MYTPCRAAVVSKTAGLDLLAGHAAQADAYERTTGHTVVIGARQQGKSYKLAVDRVRKVAKGATINGTYRMAPEPALDAFRADLLRIVGD